MLQIGEFAGLTGLSVKALRHYDEKAVLVPAEVDDLSGYRRYGEGQVRAGVLVRVLRDAGVPLPAVAAAVTAGGAGGAGAGMDAEVGAALTEHRRRILAARVDEDRAFAAATETVRALSVPVPVEMREMAEQPFIGQVIPVAADDVDSLSDEDADAVFGELFERLRASGLGPSGRFWTTLRAGDRGTIEIVCCWPTLTELDSAECGPQAFAGTLPARTELVSTWTPAAGEMLPDGAMHPAVVALFDAVAERRIELRGTEVRQSVLGQSEQDYSVEVAVSVTTR
ncbi:DNA-binding transcriptional MerR regulator [Microbacterium resistens]|uniref:DNA-binding transcriptional MerR regulator n=1 Tax=Microbacterium resistens TaxID=156977 RepID=A0ABU1SD28_9MICO|nr:MerR family DNA-binding transcriptional regulator [Microbacterium resistens]MDR6867501.1 DNA-binding transcriptional MerR regulator [Microbacterium resistens]